MADFGYIRVSKAVSNAKYQKLEGEMSFVTL
jgi:hypothetical protein